MSESKKCISNKYRVTAVVSYHNTEVNLQRALTCLTLAPTRKLLKL